MLTPTILTVGATKPPLTAYSESLPNSVVKIDMVPIPAGQITIGDKKVDVKPFYMAKTDTVWEAFDVFLASGPSSPPYDQTKFAADAIARPSKSYILPDLGWGHYGYPAINVSFDSVTMFCRWLSKVTGKKYRLPTEAEWEWAARAGDTKPWPLDFDLIEKSSWYSGNSKATTHPVGKKAANGFGLFDMLGDVGNWAIGLDGKPVLCGSSFLDGTDDVAPTTRQHWSPKWQVSDPQLPKSRWWLSDGSFVGFRVVCEP
jgi:formylglycine-generating enzyme required for sulfatase activity